MDGYFPKPQDEKIEDLKRLFPEVFDEGRIDWEKLKAALGENVNFSNERYVLNWAGKSDAFRIMQQPSSQTLVPAREESVHFDTTGNIFIEGENLEALKVLQKSYFGQVKMIYIDPPYNTGNDSFIYPDKFSETKEEYQQRVGDRDDDGYMTKEGLFRRNSKENGQYHSNWLSMMMPRLYLARNLMRDDGVIFVSIDDNEVHNLRLLMNEVFGEENFVGEFIWKRRQRADSRNQNRVSLDHEYIICFSKSEIAIFTGEKIDSSKYKNPDNDPRGKWASIDLSGLANSTQRPNLHYDIVDPETGISYKPNPNRGWSKSKPVVEKMIAEKRILFPSMEYGRPREKKFLKDLLSDVTGFSTCLNNDAVGYTTNGTREMMNLFNMKPFDFPKSVALIKLFVEQVTQSDDLILDFFAGSGTTAHAVMQLNKEDGGHRRFICVQMSEPCDEKSEAFKAGYKTIADISKERIRRAGKKIQAEIDAEDEKKKGELSLDGAESVPAIDLGFKVFKLRDSNFKQWRQVKGNDVDAVQLQMQDFIDPVAPDASIDNMAYELLLKSGKDLDSKVEHAGGIYCINDTELVFMLETATQAIVDAVLALHPKKVIALDRLFEDNDQLKTNTSLQMRDSGIEFKTI